MKSSLCRILVLKTHDVKKNASVPVDFEIISSFFTYLAYLSQLKVVSIERCS